MEFNEFREKVKEALPDFLTDDLRNAEIKDTAVNKLQGESYSGISVTPEGSRVGVSINLEDAFLDYQTGSQFTAVMNRLADTLVGTLGERDQFDLGFLTDYSAVKEMLTVEVVGKDQNAEMLHSVPHQEMEDLAAVYRIDLGETENGNATVLITNEMMRNYGLTLDQLHKDALDAAQHTMKYSMGYTAQQTLDYTQSLYEKKMVTYPRTDSRYLTEDMAAMIPDLVQKTAKKFSFSDEAVPVQAGQVINNKKVTDHHAIIPTKTAAETDLSALPAGEQAVLELIARRLVCAVGIPCESDETAVELSCAGSVFKAKGSIVTEPGWKAFISGIESGKEDKEEDASSIPDVQNGMELTVREAVCKEGKTVPPKHYTEASLLQAMENAGAEEMPEDTERKGLGTPATRAGIIEKLVRTGFLERTGNKKTKYLIPTQKGTSLVTILPEQIQSVSMTAEWEEKLLEIEQGKYSGDAFMREIEAMISDLVKNYQIVPDAEILMPKQKSQEIGKYHVCGNDVIEGAKGWFCVNRSCPFALWKQNRYFDSIGKKITASVAEKLLANGKVRMKGCKSAKTGKTFDAVLILETDADGKARFRLDFEGGKK